MTWRNCSTCKKPIAYGASYVVCSVTTCNRKRTGMVFCTEPCWDSHVPIMNHRDAWWEQKRAPQTASEAADLAAQSSSSRSPRGARKEVVPTTIQDSGKATREVLIVGTRMKSYILERAQMNTSEQAFRPMSDIVRAACDEAIQRAAADGRKTVKDRDFRSADKGGSEVMVIVSRLKAYILAKSGLKTSETCLGPMSDIVRATARTAIRAAAMDDRKTVLDRDVPSSLEALS